MSSILVTDVHFASAGKEKEASGLLGVVRFTLNNDLAVDGIALRRSTDDRFYLSYPSRTDRFGQRHPYLRPLGDGARRQIEDQVFLALGLSETAP